MVQVTHGRALTFSFPQREIEAECMAASNQGMVINMDYRYMDPEVLSSNKNQIL